MLYSQILVINFLFKNISKLHKSSKACEYNTFVKEFLSSAMVPLE